MGCTVSNPRPNEGGQPPANVNGQAGAGAAAVESFPPKDWDASLPVWTKAYLDKKRIDFWETRVEGRADLWQVLRGAAGADEATGRAMASSAGLSPYRVNEAKKDCYCYDEKGFAYIVPLWVLFTPKQTGTAKRKSTVPEKKSEDVLKREAADVTFHVRFSDGQADLKLTTQGSTVITDLRQAIQGERGIPTAYQKIFYLGRQCRGHHNLTFYSGM
jgi:hypothetical protein